MRCLILNIILILLLSAKIYSQDIQFSGYAIDLPYYQRVNEVISNLTNSKQDQLLNLTRIRLRPILDFGGGTKISMEYEVQGIYLSSPIFFNFSNDKTNRQLIDMNWNLINNPSYVLNHFVDRLYLRHNFDFGNLVIGRQRISWGTGRVWNPTDLFNPIGPTNFGKIEKDGADAISFLWNAGNFTDLSIVFNLGEKIRNSNFALKFRTNYSEFDMSLISGYFDRRIIFGADFAGNFFESGVRGEGIFSADENDLKNNFVKFILGIDYQFSSKIYGLLEYQNNGEGYTDKSKYELNRLLKGEIINLNRNYIFMMATYQLHPLVNLSFSFNSNLNDGSGFLGALINYSSGDNSAIALGGQYFYGNDFDEYWYYPSSVYLKVEYYF